MNNDEFDPVGDDSLDPEVEEEELDEEGEPIDKEEEEEEGEEF